MEVKKVSCDICGGNDLVKLDGVFVCQSCGCKYSADELKQAFVQTDSTTISSLEQKLKNAETLMQLEEYRKAEDVYKTLLSDFPGDWRCWWGLYNSAKSYKGLPNGRMFADFARPNEEYYINALKLAPEDAKKYIIRIHDSYWAEYYNSVLYDDSNGRSCYFGPKPAILTELEKQAQESADLCNQVKHPHRLLETLTNTKIECQNIRFCEIRKHSVKIFATVKNNVYDKYENRHITIITDKEISDINNILKTFDDGGCYIATSVYGSYDCPEVCVLRQFRDNVLADNLLGQTFIRIYYIISPTLIKLFGNTLWFRLFWKRFLDRAIKRINSKNFITRYHEDDRNEDNEDDR